MKKSPPAPPKCEQHRLPNDEQGLCPKCWKAIDEAHKQTAKEKKRGPKVNPKTGMSKQQQIVHLHRQGYGQREISKIVYGDECYVKRVSATLKNWRQHPKFIQ